MLIWNGDGVLMRTIKKGDEVPADKMDPKVLADLKGKGLIVDPAAKSKKKKKGGNK